MATIHAEFAASLDNSRFLKAVSQMDTEMATFAKGASAEYSKVEKASTRAASTMQKNASSSRGAARANISNISYQAQDIAVQLAAGQRTSTIIAQQGSQLLSAFGVYGAIAGAVVAIGAGIYEWVTNTKKAAAGAKEFRDTLSGFEQMQRGTQTMALSRQGDDMGARQSRINDEYLTAVETLDLKRQEREEEGKTVNYAEEALKLQGLKLRREEQMLQLAEDINRQETLTARQSEIATAQANIRGSAEEKTLAALQMQESFLQAKITYERQSQQEIQKTNALIKANQLQQRAVLEGRTMGKTGGDIQRQLRSERMQRRAEERNEKRLNASLGLTDIKRDINGQIISGRDIISGKRMTLDKAAREARQKQFAGMFGPNVKKDAMTATIEQKSIDQITVAIKQTMQALITQ